MVRRQELTFIDDSTLLILSSIGLLCVGVAVLWVIRQSPDWAVKEVRVRMLIQIMVCREACCTSCWTNIQYCM